MTDLKGRREDRRLRVPADDMTPLFVPEWDAFSAVLREMLAEAGHVLLEMSPGCAIRSICSRAERGAKDDDDAIGKAA